MEAIKTALEQYSDGTSYSISVDQLRQIVDAHTPKDKPKRAPSAFLLWKSENKDFILSKIDNNGRGVLAQKAGELWKELSDEDKAPYNERAEIAKQKYFEEMEEYKATVVVTKPKSSRGRPRLSSEEKAERKKKREEKKKESTPCPVPKENENDYEEVEINCEEFFYEGKEYLIDTNNGDILDTESEEVIGKKVGDKVVFN